MARAWPFVLLAHVSAGCGGNVLVTTGSAPDAAEAHTPAARDAATDQLGDTTTDAVPEVGGKPPGGPCSSSGECTGSCASGTCSLGAEGYPCRSGADSRTNLCSSGYCSRSAEGGQCVFDSDCLGAACVYAAPGAPVGACHCQHSGATDPDPYIVCCSGYDVLGKCSAYIDTRCLSSADCFGGTCASSQCRCVGPQGTCSADTECCAGATHCIQSTCQ